uniref:Uncharacterized protein n=1 Tax=Trypanosoma congolense (strain IL3000) TaxID=1068625 RepID=G0URU6_TRYCI|nr:hypothetical protein, unlikely [Trypanosoma congolense IL3000]
MCYWRRILKTDEFCLNWYNYNVVFFFVIIINFFLITSVNITCTVLYPFTLVCRCTATCVILTSELSNIYIYICVYIYWFLQCNCSCLCYARYCVFLLLLPSHGLCLFFPLLVLAYCFSLH